MDQTMKLKYLIDVLSEERRAYNDYYKNEAQAGDQEISEGLLRELFNQRPPLPVSAEFLAVQDDYIQKENDSRQQFTIDELDEVQPNLYLFQGDITTLKIDAIVNAANSEMLGCFIPRHQCIDNIIHTRAGVQLRLACHALMAAQGKKEPIGKAKITPGFNLPSKYVIHTVGPRIADEVSPMQRNLLAKCYRECLTLADGMGLSEIAFCCISTGEFRFPNDLAAEIAVKTVTDYIAHNHSKMKVIFNVFKDEDFRIYQNILKS